MQTAKHTRKTTRHPGKSVYREDFLPLEVSLFLIFAGACSAPYFLALHLGVA